MQLCSWNQMHGRRDRTKTTSSTPIGGHIANVRSKVVASLHLSASADVLSESGSCRLFCIVPFPSMEQPASPDNNGNWQSPWDQAKGSDSPELNSLPPEFLQRYLHEQYSRNLQAYAMEQISVLAESLRGYFADVIQKGLEDETSVQSMALMAQQIHDFRADYLDKLSRVSTEAMEELEFVRSLSLERCNDLTGTVEQGLVATVLDAHQSGRLAPVKIHRFELVQELGFIANLPESLASKEFMADQLVASYLTGTYQPNPSSRVGVAKSIENVQASTKSFDRWHQLNAIENLLRPYLTGIGIYNAQETDQ